MKLKTRIEKAESQAGGGGAVVVGVQFEEAAGPGSVSVESELMTEAEFARRYPKGELVKIVFQDAADKPAQP